MYINDNLWNKERTFKSWCYWESSYYSDVACRNETETTISIAFTGPRFLKKPERVQGFQENQDLKTNCTVIKYVETFYGRHTALHPNCSCQIKFITVSIGNKVHIIEQTLECRFCWKSLYTSDVVHRAVYEPQATIYTELVFKDTGHQNDPNHLYTLFLSLYPNINIIMYYIFYSLDFILLNDLIVFYPYHKILKKNMFRSKVTVKSIIHSIFFSVIHFKKTTKIWKEAVTKKRLDARLKQYINLQICQSSFSSAS